MCSLRFWLFVISLILTIFLSSARPSEIIADTLKTAVAVRTDTKIRIDGHLNEEAWQTAATIYGFRQTEPDEGESASESTYVRILYDDEALYVGFWCYDKEPDRIIKQLTRRDRWPASDRVAIRIDSHHDHRTAYFFGVNVSGVLCDILLYDNDMDDDTWDAVWTASTKMTDWGWTAEFEIPYSALRFSKTEEYIWGINLSRNIPRRNEDARWQFVPSSETAGVSRFGHLAGIKGIEPPGRLETMPYLVSYEMTEPSSRGNADGREFISNIGADIKYGISSALTLDAAINPDFGQVESDEAVINLSVFETQYEEKRPFFLEGTEIFNTEFFNQFYSRRIGRSPCTEFENAAYYIDYPRQTTILSALKLTGKTETGTSIGILNTMTQEESAKYKTDTLPDSPTYKGVVEPLANYTVARVKQDIMGNSFIGGMFTSANQKDRPDAYTGSADWMLSFLDNKYNWRGMLIGTNNGPGTEGYGGATYLQRVGGKIVRGTFTYYYLDDKVNWNRLGYINRNSQWGDNGWLQLRSNKKFSIIKYIRLNFNYWYAKNLDGYRIEKGGNINGSLGFTNNWWLSAGRGISDKVYDDMETRGYGLWIQPSGTEFWINFNTNEANKIFWELNYGQGEGRYGIYNAYSVWSNLRPRANLELSLGASFAPSRNLDYWMGIGQDTLPIFGSLDNDEFDLNLRGTYTFTRNLTLQWFTQFYFSTGDFDEIKKLIAADKYEPVDDTAYQIDYDRNDFNYKALNLNLILRWEYRTGSTLYLVWTHAREESLDGFGQFKFSREFGDLFATPQANTFLIKANYWWNI
jgi:hypothetical protein